jgi:hypothetical protein
MAPFNIFLIIFIFSTVIYLTDVIFNKQELAQKYKFQVSSLMFFILTLVIGLKGTIGSDYGSYYLDFIYVKEYYEDNFQFKTQSLDFVYEFLANLVVSTELTFNYLSLLIGAIFVASIIFFACKEKDYLLIILIFLSYHYYILGMGYIRQGLSIAFILFFINSWRNQKVIQSFVFFILAVLSHKFSICYCFLMFIRPKGNWFYLNIYFYVVLLIGLVVISFKIFSANDILYYIEVYTGEISKGAYYRILAFAICAILFFSYKSNFKKRADYRYLYLSANILLLLIPISLIFSTMADRIASYFIPFVFIVLGNLADILNKVYSKNIKFFLVIILFTHLFLWTNLSYQAQYYVPFHMLDKPSDKINPYKYMNDKKYCC